jgi:hypothetical protein
MIEYANLDRWESLDRRWYERIQYLTDPASAWIRLDLTALDSARRLERAAPMGRPRGQNNQDRDWIVKQYRVHVDVQQC